MAVPPIMTAESPPPHWVDTDFLAELGVSTLPGDEPSVELCESHQTLEPASVGAALGSPVGEEPPSEPASSLGRAVVIREAELPAPLGPLTQEKGHSGSSRPPWLAGFTCGKCPQPMRPYEERAGSTCSFLAWCWQTCSFVEVSEWVPFVPTLWETRYTERCTPCATSMKRWLRSQRDWEDIATVSANAPGTPRVVFVTLTMPNSACEADDTEARQNAVRAFKSEVAKWRRSAGVSDHFLGGFDYYEQTEKPEGARVSLNTHHHGVWVMRSYWPQAAMQDSWGRGIVHIREVKSPKTALRYVAKYANKQSMAGVRTRERWGSCRGSALTALREST